MDRIVEMLQDDSGPMRTMVGHWVDMVLNDIASRGLLKTLKREESTSLVEGQRQYELPPDTDHVYKVFVPAWGDPDGYMHKKNEEEFLSMMFQDGFSYTGRPHSYNIFAQFTLRLHPIPNAASAPANPSSLQKIYIWKYKDIDTLPNTVDITELKAKHIVTLIYGCYALGAHFDSIVDAKDADIKYERGVKRIVGDSNLEWDRATQTRYRDLG